MTTQPNVEAGRQLRAMRVLLGLRQVELAQRAGVSRKTIVHAEKGGALHPATRAVIERALGIVRTAEVPGGS